MNWVIDYMPSGRKTEGRMPQNNTERNKKNRLNLNNRGPFLDPNPKIFPKPNTTLDNKLRRLLLIQHFQTEFAKELVIEPC